MKTAFLIPGQGAQGVGMGADIAGAFEEAACVYEKANEILGYDLKSICFDGPAEKLNTTTVSQPAIFATSAAVLEVFRALDYTKQIQPDITAGLSLGEYTALYAAGVMSFEEGLKLVAKRGQAMQADADAQSGSMVSIIGLEEDKVRQLCEAAAQDELLEPVNFNCPGQIVVSGTKTACNRAVEFAAEYGAIKAVPLEVAGAFHTDMMSTAAEILEQALRQCNISEPSQVKTIANIDGQYYQTAENVIKGLTKQLTCPILWQKCMEKLLGDGVGKFYEIGPGRVLTGLMRRINRKIKVVNVSSLRALNELSGNA